MRRSAPPPAHASSPPAPHAGATRSATVYSHSAPADTRHYCRYYRYTCVVRVIFYLLNLAYLILNLVVKYEGVKEAKLFQV